MKHNARDRKQRTSATRVRVGWLLLIPGILMSSIGCDNSRNDTTARATVPGPTHKNSEVNAASAPHTNSGEVTASNESTTADPAHNSSTESVNSASPNNSIAVETKGVLPVFRPDDNRTQHDDQKLAAAGIQKYESKHLVLYTDITDPEAAELPAIADEHYEALVNYFGPLLPGRDGKVFQMTGYLMVDEELFRQFGLVPDELPTFAHGRHSGQNFWMYEQQSDYYRRHLLLHEATHCFMTIGLNPYPPVWYLEGMAEVFATHRRGEGGHWEFDVMPGQSEDFSGWGNIALISERLEAGQPLRLDNVRQLKPHDFMKKDGYSWSWALCKWLKSHPRYRGSFQALSQKLHQAPFAQLMEQHFSVEMGEMRREWPLYVMGLERGYDFQLSQVDFPADGPSDSGQTGPEIDIKAHLGWQYAGFVVEAGRSYRIQATGSVVLDTQPKPWKSEPQGITVSYAYGYPMGRLLGTIVPTTSEESGEAPWQIISIGNGQRLKAQSSGMLFLRVNDHQSRLADNTGSYRVTVEVAADAP